MEDFNIYLVLDTRRQPSQTVIVTRMLQDEVMEIIQSRGIRT